MVDLTGGQKLMSIEVPEMPAPSGSNVLCYQARSARESRP